MSEKSFEERVCEFVTREYSLYQGSYLCGKCAEIVSYLLSMNGVRCEKVSCKVGGVGHILVKSGNYFIDPSIKQFGDYPEFSVGEYPIDGVDFLSSAIPEVIYNQSKQEMGAYPTQCKLCHRPAGILVDGYCGACMRNPV